jgi:hypothetical protein
MGSIVRRVVFRWLCGGAGMDRGNEFECEFRARRIRVRGDGFHGQLIQNETGVLPVEDGTSWLVRDLIFKTGLPRN